MMATKLHKYTENDVKSDVMKCRVVRSKISLTGKQLQNYLLQIFEPIEIYATTPFLSSHKLVYHLLMADYHLK